MTQKILLTRPRAASERWALLLTARGFSCVIEPLLTIAPTHAPRPSGVFQAILITSANALEETNLSLTDLLLLPCFCVGAATGNAARRVGFTDVRCGASNGAELAQRVASTPELCTFALGQHKSSNKSGGIPLPLREGLGEGCNKQQSSAFIHTSPSPSLKGRGIRAVLADKWGLFLWRKHIAHPQTPSLLHISGDIIDNKVQKTLTQNGFTVTQWVTYRAHAAEDFTPSTRASFAAKEFTAVPIFSPRSAKILVSLIEKNNLQDACSYLTVVALSQTVANVLQSLPWQQLCVAVTPAEEDVLNCLSGL